MEPISHQNFPSSFNNNIPLILLITFITILVIIIHQSSRSRRSSKPSPPPGPWKLPIIGNLHQLVNSQPHRRLAELARRYGPDVMHLQLGQLSHVIISTPEAAKQVMKTHDLTFASRPPLLAPYIMFGGGYNDIAFAPYGEHWRQLRKICTLELLSAKRVRSFRSIREQEVSNLVTACSNGGDDGVVDLSDMAEKLSGSVTCRAVFGTVRGLTKAFVTVANNYVDFLGGFRISDLYPSLTFLPILTGFKGKLENMYREADSILEAIIDERRSTRILSSSGSDGKAEDDYLVDVLLNVHENPDLLGFPLTMDVVKAVTLDLFVAGIDTSSKVIEWTMSEMIKHPRVMQMVQKEVREVFGEKGKVEEAGLHRLKYLDCVIKESLRLHPPGPLLLPREAGDNVEICGYEVPANTKVFVNVWAIGRDPRYWTEAEEFYPERFVDCKTDYKGNDFQFIPFGAGRRICPGYGFGVEVVKLTLANLIYHFCWKLPSEMRLESLDMTERFGASIGRKYALRVIPVPYHEN